LHIPKQSSNHEFFNTTTSNDELVILLVPGEKELVVNDHLFMYIALLFFFERPGQLCPVFINKEKREFTSQSAWKARTINRLLTQKKDQQGSRDAWPLQKPTI